MICSENQSTSHSSVEATQLECLLRTRLAGRVRDLHVLPQSQGLILRGHSRTYYAKQLAQHAIMQETRLPILANEIEVR